MQLRERQRQFSDRCHAALNEHGNTVGVAPTGAGKTVMGSHILGRRRPQRALVLQHRDELVIQNRTTFELVCPGMSTGLYTAARKEFGYSVTFAMVQTLVRNLDELPPIDVVFTDECHHSAADSYMRIFDAIEKRNPKWLHFGLTATPNRGDKKALRGVYTNCADQITLTELIKAGHLVPPRMFVIDIGVREELSHVRKTLSDFDMSEVEKIMDKQVLNDRVVDEWRRLAGNRQTVVFCSTVAHASHVVDAFRHAGVKAILIDGDLPASQRQSMLAAYDRGEHQVVVNVAVLTEGWDHQPTSCVILLRPSSYKSTMMQMVGRGLRKVDPSRYPGARKDDCIVIDFGTSILQHGGIEQSVNLEQQGTKNCAECDAVVPMQANDCPICGYVFPKPPAIDADDPSALKSAINEASGPAERGELSDFQLTEITLFDASPFKWEPLFDGMVQVACAFDAWAMVVSYMGRYHAFGGRKGSPIEHLADNGERLISLASADDYMRAHGDEDSGSKARRWLHMPPTDRQLQMLGLSSAAGFGMTRYQASCHMQWNFAERQIRRILEMTRQIAA